MSAIDEAPCSQCGYPENHENHITEAQCAKGSRVGCLNPHRHHPYVPKAVPDRIAVKA